jgi:DNA-binding transcriptional LysR family regulator
MVRSEWLQAFGAFAERLSFTQAARALHLSQPALFVQIKKLTEEIGVPLYEKHGQRLSLTPAGEKLLAFARESEERDSELLEELRTGERNSAVTLAAGEGAYLYLLSKPLRESKARLRLLVKDRAGTIDAVKRGEAQLGVAVLDAIPDGLEAQLLARVPQVLVTPRREAKEKVSLKDLSGASLIVPPIGQPQRATLEQALAGIDWRVAVEATGWPLVLRFVEMGVGWAIVNGICEIPASLAARPIAELPRASYHVLSRKRLSSEAKRVKSHLLNRG